ncbi:MAG: DUF4250 domain-containing protein [Muribaculaceae bacterium]|nr:DUF4250 domain-containing protein [Muribaculaceae bacterium]
MTLPQDPFMLLSFINMKLRDGEYEDLADLCSVLDCNEDELRKTLKEAGFEYVESLKQFK